MKTFEKSHAFSSLPFTCSISEIAVRSLIIAILEWFDLIHLVTLLYRTDDSVTLSKLSYSPLSFILAHFKHAHIYSSKFDCATLNEGTVYLQSCTHNLSPIYSYFHQEPRNKHYYRIMKPSLRWLSLRNIKYYFTLVFSNLTLSQRILQWMRLGSSFLTICLTTALFIFRNDPKHAYIARINCGRLNVGSGLFHSIGSAISVSNQDFRAKFLKPLGSSLTDAEVNILAEYTNSKIEDAPQYIDLGENVWCYGTYETQKDYWDLDNKSAKPKITTTCEAYNDFNLLDIKGILSYNHLSVIVAYAFQWDGVSDEQYGKEVSIRLKQYHASSIIIDVQIFIQILLLSTGVFVYGNRGHAKDLHKIPKSTLNVVAIVSILTALIIIASTVMVTYSMQEMKARVHKNLSSYGINMTLGNLYFTFIWLTFGFTMLCTLSWVVPLWCANPPENVYWEESTADNASGRLRVTEEEHYTIKPYQFDRSTKQNKKVKRSASNFLDESYETSQELTNLSDSSDTAENTGDLSEPEMFYGLESSSRIHSQRELLKLGEKMSYRPPVRKMSRKIPTMNIPPQEETRKLLYRENPFSGHQYPKALPQSEDLSSTEPNNSLLRSSSGVRTRVLSDNVPHPDSSTAAAVENPFLEEMSIKSQKRPVSFGMASVLNEEEMDYLDQNHLVNRL
ncbi:hypothetical protein EJF18_10288 [Clavispora lusitaniae]|uniref:Uncharacterized protein n=1 Tax=Clavispora lusitaniae TaxID=36911 RepID=A0ACD0WCK6_CLALS|nr:hypothetical protein EJF14_10288 [Clavispora lusitaniae]QFZ31500.1 hypothetical protein EJF16_10288 [Clavispora lusitaniae]QFZ37168.1 hypothetical protein EJF15_10288 [Clavispora lusitaniae]QFZ42852.1 hypothetical protein EJF18_10288 [Clavispora lusitaniae]QFZ48528.1 hypothetical protein EJF17_10288 [Clavispora lusitaniae]